MHDWTGNGHQFLLGNLKLQKTRQISRFSIRSTRTIQLRTNNPLTLLVTSVTATFILDLIVSGSSNKYMQLFWSLSDFDIFFSGWRKLLIRRLDSSVTRTVSGIGNNLHLNLVLNLLAIFRVSSTFCSWSSPTGTLVALYSSISAACRHNNLGLVIRFSEQQYQKYPIFTCTLSWTS